MHQYGTLKHNSDTALTATGGASSAGLAGTGLSFGAASKLDLYGGSIVVKQGNVNIAPGASVFGHNIPQVSGLAVGQSYSQDFIVINDVNTGEILGTLQALDTLTLSYNLEIIDDQTYRITVLRTADASNPGNPGDPGNPGNPGNPGTPSVFLAKERNTIELLQGVESVLLGQTTPLAENAPWNLIMQDLDGQTNARSYVRAANRYARYGTPQATTRAFNLMQRQQRAAGGILSRQLFAGLPTEPEAVYLASANGYTPLPSPGVHYTGWALPFHQSGRTEAKSADFSDMDEHFTGISLGGTAAWDSTVLALGFHYVSGTMDAAGFDASSDSTGLQLGLGRRFEVNDTFSPWAEIRLGYTYQSFEQTRKDFLGQEHDSSPDAHLLSAGALVSNDFTFGSFTLSPHLGLEYTHIDMDNYKEDNNSNHAALKVKPDGHDSLIGNAGADLRWNVSDLVTLEARGNYYYEFVDTDVKLRSSAASSPGMSFVTYGQDDNGHMGSLGLGVKLTPDDKFSFNLNYDLHLGDHYTGHQVEAGFKIRF